MYRGADSGAAVAHHRAYKNVIALFHSGRARGADVLLHGQNNPFRGRHNGRGDVPGVLVMRHRRAAVSTEGMLWKLHSMMPAFPLVREPRR